uniref:Sugar phosphate isomerase/epimerase n=1 Tax=Geoglobus ahangari TaxID=113653 RepID=A0A7C3YLK1_9EURY
MIGFQPDIDQDIFQAFEFAKRNDFDHIELLMDHPFYHYKILNAKEVAELSMSYDVEIILHASATQTNFLAISPELRMASYRELTNTIKFAEKCEAKLITFHIGWNPGFITARGFVFREEWYDKHNENVLINEMIPYLKKYGEILSLENTINITRGIKRGIEEILRETEVNLTFDIGHYNVKENHEIFLKHFDRVKNIHLHDNRGEFDEHLSLGEGSIDFSIIPKDYRGYLTIEVRDRDGILRSKEFIKNYIYEHKVNLR